MKIKPLTFGQARFHHSRPVHLSWRNKILEFSEKEESVFWDVAGAVFCSFVEDGVPYFEAIKKGEKTEHFRVIPIGIETMRLIFIGITYSDTENGLLCAREDFISGKLTSKFLTKAIF